MNPGQEGEKLLSGDWEFDTGGVLKELVEHYPQDKFKFYMFLANEMTNIVDQSTPVYFPVLVLLILSTHLDEPPPFLRRKAHGANDEEILDLHTLKLRWELTNQFCSDVPVHALHCDRSLQDIAQLSDHRRINYKGSFLMDCRTSKAFPMQKNGKLLVENAKFSVTLPNGKDVTGHYWKDQGKLDDFIDEFIEDEGLDDDDETKECVNYAIVTAFNKKRENLKLQQARIFETFRDGDNDLLEQVKCAKIYPSNSAERDIGQKTKQLQTSYGPADHMYS